MKKIKLAHKIAVLNIIFFIGYNTYFGWNMYSLSEAETNCDNIFKVVNFLFMILYFLPLLDAYEKFIKNYLK
ncbi:hypothetical protein Freya6_3 [Polaribacter phage Freya_6]|nr:hypothetical protein Freya6_3 [Polaribacter phage Freya_6]QYW00023.1 hypothetical protein Freya7_3 [Polaribacter phage Freya_7]